MASHRSASSRFKLATHVQSARVSWASFWFLSVVFHAAWPTNMMSGPVKVNACNQTHDYRDNDRENDNILPNDGSRVYDNICSNQCPFGSDRDHRGHALLSGFWLSPTTRAFGQGPKFRGPTAESSCEVIENSPAQLQFLGRWQPYNAC